MSTHSSHKTTVHISSLDELATLASYSFMDSLSCDPDATDKGADHDPRQVFSGHYVPVKPTPIENPAYVTHSKQFFKELGLADSLSKSADFMRVFSGDLSQVPAPMRRHGWATGYALSIFGTEYTQQCPFKTGNGYGDGRAVSVLEVAIPDNGPDHNSHQRWEMQLKGGGRTPYCRGADGRAVLRSSVREFLAQEHMHALGVPTSRSLTLYVSKTETVKRPWYSEGSRSFDPDIMVAEPVAISTRVAPSFIRVGQLELFGRRARKQEHPDALNELEQIVLHLIEREYAEAIDSPDKQGLSMPDKVVLLAGEFRSRLISLVANWMRVGYCQGNFNSDNTQAGGCTLDYGPFGFMEVFDPYYQPWTGGGEHFSFWNQPVAAQHNFDMFCTALMPLLQQDVESHTGAHADALQQLEQIRDGFSEAMQAELEKMFAAKLGLETLDIDLFNDLLNLMRQTSVDYTIFFRELSSKPDDIGPLRKSFYRETNADLDERWSEWLRKWQSLMTHSREQMQCINPKYTLREWLLAPAYQQAAIGNYELIHELQDVMTQPYAEQSKEVEAKYYRRRPADVNALGGYSHMSCSS